ncbi:Protein singed [Orchesella cincta]|uniref:Fascin n=1 Tax=Orchesella cincta TaxID=48709 RepID=A0A1D2MJZ7_ORCCI|nr:Protein singed [Orchesella cincta]
MNGIHSNGNGITNGAEGSCWEKGIWLVGLINSQFKYLTAETFGYKINANGISLKKKQTWTLEPAGDGSESICLKSHLERYLAVDQFGNVTCDATEKDYESYFEISVQNETGKWALRNISRGYYLGAAPDKLICTAKAPAESEYWSVHIAARPQVTLKSVGRKRYAHLADNEDEIYVDSNVPWGADTLFTLEFREGNYAIHSCNNKYLHRDGKLQDNCDKDCLFSIEYHHGQLALRDFRGLYLAPIGSKAVLKTRSHIATKDELFILEDSLPQAAFIAALNSRYVSVKQGVDVTANQNEISNYETFQLEFDQTTKRWYIRTMQDKYWTLETAGGIQASADKKSSNALFELTWLEDGAVAFRANNGKYVGAKRSGHLYANCDVPDENSKYYFYLINRPILVLKCEQGYVGYKTNACPRLECNKATYETIQVERDDKGIVHFKGQSGKYWAVSGDEVTADADAAQNFYLELREPTKICIKTAAGQYLSSEKNGIFRVGDTNPDTATKWEF